MSSILSVKRGALVGVVLVSTALGADAMTVARCKVMSDGIYRPALVVEANGETTVHLIGEDGLTRQTVFNRKAALAWAAEHYGGSFSWLPGSSCDTMDIPAVVEEQDHGDPGGYLRP